MRENNIIGNLQIMGYNEITGDNIATRLGNKEAQENFENNFDRIFGKKKKEKYIPPPLNTDKLEWTEDQDPDSWNDKRMDIIGQNGNVGYDNEP